MVDQPAHSAPASVRQSGGDLVVGGLGFLTSLTTAVILWWVELQFGVAFYSWTLWFVIPGGAMLAGLAGASGYYAGARLFHRRPSRVLLVNVLCASVATFLFIHYLSYVTLEVEGVLVSDALPFWQYLDIVIRSTSMGFVRARGAATGELGDFGYVIALLQVLGFAGGGFLVYTFLSDLPYCARCSRYLAAKGSLDRFSHDPEGVVETATAVLDLVRAGELTDAIAVHEAFGDRTPQRGDYLRLKVTVRRCTRCDQHWMKFEVSKWGGDEWKELPELTAGCFTDEAISIGQTQGTPDGEE